MGWRTRQEQVRFEQCFPHRQLLSFEDYVRLPPLAVPQVLQTASIKDRITSSEDTTTALHTTRKQAAWIRRIISAVTRSKSYAQSEYLGGTREYMIPVVEQAASGGPNSSNGPPAIWHRSPPPPSKQS